jgi:mono/diheme cytochrome c family protein
LQNQKVITIAGTIIVAALGAMYFTGAFDQSGDKSAKADGQPTVKVVVPELGQIAKLGEEDFNTNCAACHGKNAAGTNSGPPLIHRIYEPNHHADIAFKLAANRGVRAHHWNFGNMPPQSQVKDYEMVRIVAYVRELQKANGIF